MYKEKNGTSFDLRGFLSEGKGSNIEVEDAREASGLGASFGVERKTCPRKNRSCIIKFCCLN